MKKRHKTFICKAGTNGFTLMELLVVISIISMLMSIMLPGLNRSREQAQRVVCGSNMRQLTMFWTIYAYENDDMLCSADTGFNISGEGNWVADGPFIPGNFIGGTEQAIKDGSLWKYTQTVDLYKCKTDRSYRLRSYAISRAMNGKTCNCEHDNINPHRGLTSIANPTTKMVFTDATAKTEWIEGSFCQVKDITAVPPEWFVRNSRNITARHGEGSNISFADMHCEYLKWKDRRTVRLAEWEIGALEASDRNRDLANMVQLIKGL